MRGEEAALRHLRTLGWRILARRYRVRGGEVDIVAESGATIVFVEVKARSVGGLDDGGGAVDAGKRRRLARAAGVFLVEHRLTERPCRFDVVLVRLAEAGDAVRHLPAAFDLNTG